MTPCIYCGFHDRRNHRFTELIVKGDGWPLLSVKRQCIECRREHVTDQFWGQIAYLAAQFAVLEMLGRSGTHKGSAK